MKDEIRQDIARGAMDIFLTQDERTSIVRAVINKDISRLTELLQDAEAYCTYEDFTNVTLATEMIDVYSTALHLVNKYSTIMENVDE